MDGYNIDGKLMNAKTYVNNLLLSSDFFNLNNLPNVEVSTFKECPVSYNKNIREKDAKDKLCDKGALQGAKDAFDLLNGNSMAAKILKNFFEAVSEAGQKNHDESPMYIPYDKTNGDILTACLNEEGALKVSKTYITILGKEHSRMLAYPNNWVEGFKVNLDTLKIEDRTDEEIAEYRERHRV